MRAMVMRAPRGRVEVEERPRPTPVEGQLLLRVRACAVCRTDLHILDGDLTEPALPLVLGHEIVGEVVEVGANARGWEVGTRVGVPWLGWTCGECDPCGRGDENLCDTARFTGYQLDGGFAEFTVADARYCFALPPELGDIEAAPLLCAGLIGYRALRMAGDAPRVGLYGFGAAAHILTQIARAEDRRVFAFTRAGDQDRQHFARELGAEWAGDSDSDPPVPLDAALIFAPVGDLVPRALQHVRKGGVVICAGIHMSDIPTFPYELLWGERSVRSVANLTRRDAVEFLAVAARTRLRIHTTSYPLERANDALADLRAGRIRGAAVLVSGTPTEPFEPGAFPRSGRAP